jgi:prevent-host-death family protein
MKVELVTTLKRQATKILADLHESKEPVLITEHGQPSAYLIDVEDYEFMQNRMEILEGIAQGERAVVEGKTMSQKEAQGKMQKWLTYYGPSRLWEVSMILRNISR